MNTSQTTSVPIATSVPVVTSAPTPETKSTSSVSTLLIYISILALIVLLINYKGKYIPFLNDNLSISITVILVFLVYIIYDHNVSLKNMKEDIKNTDIYNLQKLLTGLIESNKSLVDEAIIKINNANIAQDELMSNIKKIIDLNNNKISDLSTNTIPNLKTLLLESIDTNKKLFDETVLKINNVNKDQYTLLNDIKNVTDNLTKQLNNTDNNFNNIKKIVDDNTDQISKLIKNTDNINNTIIPNLKTLLMGLIDGNKKLFDDAITEINKTNTNQDKLLDNIKNTIEANNQNLIKFTTETANNFNNIKDVLLPNLKTLLLDTINTNKKLFDDAIAEIKKIDSSQDTSISEIKNNISNLNNRVSTKNINIQDWNIFTDENKNLCINNGSSQNICIDMNNDLIKTNFVENFEDVYSNIKNNILSGKLNNINVSKNSDIDIIDDIYKNKINDAMNKTIGCDMNSITLDNQTYPSFLRKLMNSNNSDNYKSNLLFFFLMQKKSPVYDFTLKLINNEIYCNAPLINLAYEILLMNDDYVLPNRFETRIAKDDYNTRVDIPMKVISKFIYDYYYYLLFFPNIIIDKINKNYYKIEKYNIEPKQTLENRINDTNNMIANLPKITPGDICIVGKVTQAIVSAPDIFDLTAKLTKENFSIEHFATYDSVVLPDKITKLNIPKDFFVKNNNDIDQQIQFLVLLYDWIDILLKEVCGKPPTTDSFILKIYNFNIKNSQNFGFVDSLLLIMVLLSDKTYNKKLIVGAFTLLFLKTFTKYDEINKVIIFKNFDDKFSYDNKLNIQDYPDYKVPKDKLCELVYRNYASISTNLPDTIKNIYSNFSIC